MKREHNGNSADTQVHIKTKFEFRGYTARNNAGNRENRPNEYVSRQNRQARDRKGPLIVLVVTIIWGAITHPIEMRVTVTVPDARYSAEFRSRCGMKTEMP